MANVPKSGDWITFPLTQLHLIELEWWSNKSQQRTRYYVDKVWFGRRVNENNYNEGITPQGTKSNQQ